MEKMTPANNQGQAGKSTTISDPNKVNQTQSNNANQQQKQTSKSGNRRRNKARNRQRGAKSGGNVENTGNAKNSNKSKQKQKSKSNSNHPPPLQLPHAKITVRRIHSVDKFGTELKMASFIRKLVTGVENDENEASMKNSTTSVVTSNLQSSQSGTLEKPLIEIDEESLLRCIISSLNEGNVATNDRSTTENTESKSNSNESVTSNDVVTDQKETLEANDNGINDTKSEVKEVSDTDTQLSPVKSIIEIMNEMPVTVRVLYFIPPRKTRRRGTIPGLAYLVLYPPNPYSNSISSTATQTNNGKDVVTTNKPRLSAPLVGQERSKAVAAARLLLQNAQEQLSSNATKYASFLGDCSIELSKSQKTWKNRNNFILTPTDTSQSQQHHPRSRSDRYENTITSSEDYKKFLEAQEKQKEELQNRPKPIPGGGEIDTSMNAVSSMGIISSGGSENNTSTSGGNANDKGADNSSSMAAIVRHLNKKKEEQKAKQAMKRNSSNNNDSRGAKKGNSGSIKLLDKSKGVTMLKKTSDFGKGSTTVSTTAQRKEKKKRNKDKKSQQQNAKVLVTKQSVSSNTSSNTSGGNVDHGDAGGNKNRKNRRNRGGANNSQAKNNTVTSS